MVKKTVQSIEPNIADLANGWLKSLKLDYKLEQESLNAEIDKALSDYFTKNGGSGANRPDAKILLQDQSLNYYPILIEYKGYKDRLIKLDEHGQVENKTSKNEPHFKNINGYALNGAVHYANALLHHTSYTDIIAIGMTGYKNEQGDVVHEISAYYVSKSNLGAGQKVGDYSDFSFLAPQHFDAFIEKAKTLSLPQEELDRLKQQREQEIDVSLSKLNQDIYENEKGLGEDDRVYLVAASIIATLGIPGKVSPLEKSDLKSSPEEGSRDGDIIIRKIRAFLNVKEIPEDKKNLILRTLENTLTTENINKAHSGESQLKRVFCKIVDDLGIYYKIGLTTDFTGKLFNEMYGWLGFTQDPRNDVVLTPAYVSSLLVKLARVNKNSYVWDFAAGSAGLLVAAMNEMLIDAKNTISSPDELRQKELKIKAEQLLGLELLSSVYMLAVLNMILMGDGSSHILNKDSLTDFDGKYGFGRTDTKFPADAFVLNPPYSAPGNGMNFVEKALNFMEKGYAAIIIQSSAGSGKAVEYNKRILAKHTLLASIKMPADLFIGKASVPTYIYVFKVNEAHHPDEMVKFIDFSKDGYIRTNRKRASNNLKDTDHARERYEELVKLVRFGQSQLKFFSKNEYHEGNIDPENGADWNQIAPIDTHPSLQDFDQTVTDYLEWNISQVLSAPADDSDPDQIQQALNADQWREFRVDEIFEVAGTKSLDSNAVDFLDEGINFVGRTFANNGIQGKIQKQAFEPNPPFTITATVIGNYKYVKYQTDHYYCSQNINRLTPKPILEKWNSKIAYYFVASLQKFVSLYDGQQSGYKLDDLKGHVLKLPVKGAVVDVAFIETFMTQLEQAKLERLHTYLNEIRDADTAL